VIPTCVARCMSDLASGGVAKVKQDLCEAALGSPSTVSILHSLSLERMGSSVHLGKPLTQLETSFLNCYDVMSRLRTDKIYLWRAGATIQYLHAPPASVRRLATDH